MVILNEAKSQKAKHQGLICEILPQRGHIVANFERKMCGALVLLRGSQIRPFKVLKICTGLRIPPWKLVHWQAAPSCQTETQTTASMAAPWNPARTTERPKQEGSPPQDATRSREPHWRPYSPQHTPARPKSIWNQSAAPEKHSSWRGSAIPTG